MKGTNLKEIDLKGAKVRKSDGAINSVVDFDLNDGRYFVKLDDDKKGYSLKRVFEKQSFSFINDNLQRELIQLVSDTPLPPLPQKMPYIDDAVKLFKKEGVGRDVSNDYDYKFSKLQHGKIYGKVAEDIYLECCKKLNFKVSKSHFFAKKQILFASNATEEGLAVWMLPNNSYTGKVSGCWANVIVEDKIYEFRAIDDVGDSSDRITFAKQKDGHYVFIGIYTLESCEKIDIIQDGVHIYYLKIYKRESKTYPQED